MQTLTFLGSVLDSNLLQVSLTKFIKAHKIVSLCTDIINKKSTTIRQVAELIALMVPSSQGMYAPLFYKQLEIDETIAFKYSKGNYDAIMRLSEISKNDILWWISNMHTSFNPISHGPSLVTVHSDASLTGWGRVCNHTKCTCIHTGGHWTQEEN
jgi:hypothetical protein